MIYSEFLETKRINLLNSGFDYDERHICPLQLDVIERSLQLWSNPGDTVFTPFLGIGSEAYVSVKMSRKAIGVELKESYFKLAARNLESAHKNQYDLFG